AITPSLRASSRSPAAITRPSATVVVRASPTATAATPAMNTSAASVLIAPRIADLRYTRNVPRDPDSKSRAPKLRKARFATDADIEIQGTYAPANAPAEPP